MKDHVLQGIVDFELRFHVFDSGEKARVADTLNGATPQMVTKVNLAIGDGIAAQLRFADI